MFAIMTSVNKILLDLEGGLICISQVAKNDKKKNFLRQVLFCFVLCQRSYVTKGKYKTCKESLDPFNRILKVK